MQADQQRILPDIIDGQRNQIPRGDLNSPTLNHASTLQIDPPRHQTLAPGREHKGRKRGLTDVAAHAGPGVDK